MLPAVSAVQNRDGVTDILYSHLVDRDVAVVPLILNVFHGCATGQRGRHVRIPVSVLIQVGFLISCGVSSGLSADNPFSHDSML